MKASRSSWSDCMLARPDTPGIYVQPADASGRAISAARSDIAAFVGIADRGPIGVPVLLGSMRQFESVFGSYIGSGFLAYAARAFFENGGTLCRVVRVAAIEAEAARARIRLGDGRFALTLRASSPGSWGNGLKIHITPSRRAETRALAGGTRRATQVGSIQGIARFALARLIQGAVEEWRIVAEIDPVGATLFWTHPDPAKRAGWEASLAAIDPALAFRIERIDYDLSASENGRLTAVYAALSPVTGSPRFFPDILHLPEALSRNATSNRQPMTEAVPPPPVLPEISDGTAPDWAVVSLLDPAGSTLSLTGGCDGLIHLAPADYLHSGLAPLEQASDVAMIACPDLHIQPVRIIRDPRRPAPVDPCEPCAATDYVAATANPPQAELPPVFGPDQIHMVQAAMIDQCERLRDRVAFLAAPFAAVESGAVGPGAVRAWRSRFDSAFGALYHPWLAVADPLSRGIRMVPPCGHVAGLHAMMDHEAGPHRAAAGVPIAWAQATSLHINQSTHGLLNTAGINVITAREGRALRTLGARTMSSDPQWHFVPVRRLVCMLRDTLDIATQWAVFEPNDSATRLLLQDSIAGLLDQLWRRGALSGAVPVQAYAVQCDEINNDAERRANGELHVDIAIAPAAPLEFIVLRIGRQGNQFEMIEDGAPRMSLIGGAD